MRRRLSGAKIQNDAFDTWRFRIQTYVSRTIRGHVLTEVSKLTPTLSTFNKFVLQ